MSNLKVESLWGRSTWRSKSRSNFASLFHPVTMVTTWPGFFLEPYPEEIRHANFAGSLAAECLSTRDCNGPHKDRPRDHGELLNLENLMADSPFLILKTTGHPITQRTIPSGFSAKSGGIGVSAEKFDQDLWKKVGDLLTRGGYLRGKSGCIFRD